MYLRGKCYDDSVDESINRHAIRTSFLQPKISALVGPFLFSVLECVRLREHLVGIKIAPDRAIRPDRDA